MMAKFAQFRKDDVGAITVDWIVLFTAIVGLAVAVLSVVGNGSLDLGDRTSDYLQGIDVPVPVGGYQATEVAEDRPLTTLEDGWGSDGCLYENGVMVACQ